jgi:hypothetical protein
MVRGEESKMIEPLPDAETVEETSASRHAALPPLQPKIGELPNILEGCYRNVSASG